MSDSLYGIAQSDAAAYGVPSGLFSDIIQAESGFNPNAYNPASGASGIAQFLPSTAANPGYGVAPFNPFNPGDALSSAAQYLAALRARLGSWTGAVQAYSGVGTGTPYPGNSAIAADLQAADSGAPGKAQGGSCGFSPSCYLDALAGFLGGYAARAGLVLLAVIFLIGAMYLFATRTQIVSQSA
jgi:hypothetical protein